jgi:hypothetical protein
MPTSQLLEDIGAYLTTVYADSYSGKYALGTNLFLSLLPETPDTCMAAFEAGGVGPLLTFGATSVTQPELQIMVRNPSYEAGRSDSQELFEIFVDLAGVTVNDKTYLRISPVAMPALIQRDQNGRSIFSMNFSVTRPI